MCIINHDLIVDKVQIARSVVYGANAIVLYWDLVDNDRDRMANFINYTKSLEMEPIIGISNHQEAQSAIDIGASILYVIGKVDVKEKIDIAANLYYPRGRQICLIADISVKNNKQWSEVEEAWILRDSKMFNAVWISDALYKCGNDATEHVGAIIKSIISKSSVKWATVKTLSGRGEGSKEFLGEILM